MGSKRKIDKENSEKEFLKLWKPVNVEGIELFSANIVNYSFSKHYHETYTVGITHYGSGSFYYRGEKRSTFPGSINVLNPGEIHDGENHKCSANWRYKDFYISTKLMSKILNQMGLKNSRLPFFSEKGIDDEKLWRSLNGLFAEIINTDNKLSIQSKIIEIFSEMIEKYSDVNCSLPKISNEKVKMNIVREFLKENYTKNISIGQLSKAVNLSPYYLIRSFHKNYGLPPHAYQNQLKLQAAKEDLLKSKSMASIALEHGFYDQSHFTRQFKRTYGVTPNNYRKGNFIQEM